MKACACAAPRSRQGLANPRIANLPWEYLHLSRAGDENGLDGFLAMDPKLSIVRHEAMPMKPCDVTAASQPIRILAGFASPKNVAPLDLETERSFIKEALKDLEHVELVDFIEHLTVPKLEKVLHQTDIFHFAGHGTFGKGGVVEGARQVAAVSVQPAGQEALENGALVLENDAGNAFPFPADKLALTLRAAGVRTVVLGACESGRRSGVNIWSGIAPALMKAGIPAVIGMQYTVYDDSAIAFSQGFYESLAEGLSLDEAVVRGRLSIINESGRSLVDWGVPVLYMRSADGIVFPGISDDTKADALREELRKKIIGNKIITMTGGTVESDIELDALPEGVDEVTGNEIDDMKGGHAKSKMKIGVVKENETVVGTRLKKL